MVFQLYTNLIILIEIHQPIEIEEALIINK